MDAQTLFQVASQALGIVLVVGGAVFAVRSVWPFLEKRDTEERQRRHELRQHANTTAEAMSAALAAIAHSLCNPIRISVEDNGNEKSE